MSTPKRPQASDKPKVHRDLKGFEIGLNAFGEVVSNRAISELNDFLNRHSPDRKLSEREPPDASEVTE